MEFKDIQRFSKKAEPFIAIAVLIILISLAVLLYQDNQLKKEISKNCGWEEEAYECYCEHGDIIEIKNRLDQKINFSFIDIVEDD